MLSVGTKPRWHSRQTVKTPEMAQAHIIFRAHMIRPAQLQPRDPNIRSGGLPRNLALWSTRLGLTGIPSHKVPNGTMDLAYILR